MKPNERRSTYRKFAEEQPLSLFQQAWWLDAVCGKDQWQVELYTNQREQIDGCLTYVLTKRFGRPIILMPTMTMQGGIWLRDYPDLTPYRQQTRHKKIVEALLEKLPDYVFYVQKYPYSFRAGLPLHLAGYEFTLHYSYRIELDQSLETIWKNFDGRLRSKIRKANTLLRFETSDDPVGFYALNKLTFSRQNMDIPYSLDFVQRMDKALRENSQRFIYVARDEMGRPHGTIYVAYDHDTAWYLAAGSDPELRKSGAIQALLWHAIQEAKDRVATFDFEGSMLPEVELSFRAFGGRATPYFKVFRAKNKWWRTVGLWSGKFP